MSTWTYESPAFPREPTPGFTPWWTWVFDCLPTELAPAADNRNGVDLYLVTAIQPILKANSSLLTGTGNLLAYLFDPRALIWTRAPALDYSLSSYNGLQRAMLPVITTAGRAGLLQLIPNAVGTVEASSLELTLLGSNSKVIRVL